MKVVKYNFTHIYKIYIEHMYVLFLYNKYVHILFSDYLLSSDSHVYVCPKDMNYH